METGLASRREMRRMEAMSAACSSWVPCEKFSRATFMPAAMRAAILSSELQAGPMVQTILVRRVDRSKIHLILVWQQTNRPRHPGRGPQARRVRSGTILRAIPGFGKAQTQTGPMSEIIPKPLRFYGGGAEAAFGGCSGSIASRAGVSAPGAGWVNGPITLLATNDVHGRGVGSVPRRFSRA